MPSHGGVFLLVAITVASACKSNAYLTTPQAAGWDFIQSAGGIRIEPARRLTASSGVLPVTCDISGVKAITATPTVMHSGLVVTEMLNALRRSASTLAWNCAKFQANA